MIKVRKFGGKPLVNTKCNTSSDREPHSPLVMRAEVFAFQSPYLECLKMTSQIMNDSHIFLFFLLNVINWHYS